jgi:hypothetical protein
VFEGDLSREYKRIFERHRIDLAKMYFDKDGGYTLRELKRIFKMEMEENGERYTLALDDDREEKKKNEDKAKKAYKNAMKEGPSFGEQEDRNEEIRELREKLD